MGWDDPRRQSSLLTPAQRRYLVDDEFREETSHSYASTLRKRTRQRLASGLLDFRLLLNRYAEDECLRLVNDRITVPREAVDEEEERVLDEIRVNEMGSESMMGASSYAVGFFYRLILAGTDGKGVDESSDSLWREGFTGPHAASNYFLASQVGMGVEHALSRQGEYARARVTLELHEHGELDAAADLSEQPERALRLLLARDEITPEQYSREIIRREGGALPDGDPNNTDVK